MAAKSKPEKTQWWHQGLRFECQGSGKCCVSRDSYGYVYLTKEDRIRMAKALKMSTRNFTHQYCTKEDGVYHLIDGQDGKCLFLKDKRCQVYEGRPTQCRTWPFWPEVMDSKIWQKEVASFCPGVGQGHPWPKQKIEDMLKEQQSSEENYGS